MFYNVTPTELSFVPFLLLFLILCLLDDSSYISFFSAADTMISTDLSYNRLRVAIAYWGMTRSTRFVYETHVQNLFQVLQEAEIDYTVFMHIWRTDKNFVWADEVDIPVVENEFALLRPSVFVIEDEEEFLKGPTYNLSLYWYETEWKRSGTSGEWLPKSLSNLICSLESLKRVTNLVREESRYDLVIYVRPDVRIDMPLEPNWLHVVHAASAVGNQSVIAIPNFGHHGGLNDRFAIMPWKHCEEYGSRLTGMADYRKKIGFITPEKYLKYVVSTSYDDLMEIPFRFTIIRPDGKEWKFR